MALAHRENRIAEEGRRSSSAILFSRWAKGQMPTAFPPDIVLLALLWRLRDKLSLRDVAELFLERGWTFTPEAMRDYCARTGKVKVFVSTVDTPLS